MRSYQPSSDRRRGISLALTIVAHLLIAFLLWRLAPTLDPPPEPGRSLTVNMLPVGDNQSTATKSAKAPARATAKASRRTAPEPPAAPRAPAPDASVPPPVDTPFPGYLVLSKSDFAASDVGKMPSRKSGGGAGKQLAAANGAGDGDSGESSAAAGIGPGGQRLYKGDWYVKPSASQLDPYLPRNLPPRAWARVACRIIAGYRVEDCIGLDGSQPGLAERLRQAAWQFRVRPARINGKEQFGTWVVVTYDIITKSKDESE